MPSRSPKEPLSRGRILTAAVTIADTEGLRAVTMRRVADALDCEAMSLYHYVRDKEALLNGLSELVVGEVAAVSLDIGTATLAADWREVIRRRCLVARDVMLGHPWAPQLIASRAEAPPTAYPIFEGLVATMVDGGCSYVLAHRAIHALGSMLFGFTQELFEPGEDADVDPEELEAFARTMPHLARLAEVAAHERDGALSQCDTQAEFEFTLGLILDGLEENRKN